MGKWACVQGAQNRQEGERRPGEMPSGVSESTCQCPFLLKILQFLLTILNAYFYYNMVFSHF